MALPLRVAKAMPAINPSEDAIARFDVVSKIAAIICGPAIIVIASTSISLTILLPHVLPYLCTYNTSLIHFLLKQYLEW